MLKLENHNGMSLTLLETAGAIQSLIVPDRSGVPGDVVLGADRESDYPMPGCLGAMVGRFANRIAGAAFPLNGKTYHIPANEGPNCLHSGMGFHTRRWALERTDTGASLSLLSADGDQGFPGNLSVRVDVRLTEENALRLEYTAVCDQDTVVNLTNHSYFNLRGAGTILDQELRLDADAYLEVGPGLIPTGRLVDVTGTDFDFRSRRPIASGKYDHCFVLRPGPGVKAEAYDPVSGRGMRMETDLPGVQFYCGGGLGGVRGKDGAVYAPFGGFCLETQLFPDAPNRPSFPTALLRAGEIWNHFTQFSFFTA